MRGEGRLYERMLFEGRLFEGGLFEGGRMGIRCEGCRRADEVEKARGRARYKGKSERGELGFGGVRGVDGVIRGESVCWMMQVAK